MTPERRFVVHLDVDGLSDICRVNGWGRATAEDRVFHSGLRRALDFFDAGGITATLFVIADSLDDPDKKALLREAVRRGHEIASHTVTHPDLRTVSRERKAREVAESRARLEDGLGVRVRGFRAPGYTVDRDVVALLADHGYEYDSSAFATAAFAERLGVPHAALAGERRPFGTGLAELPLPDYRPLPFPFNPSYALLLGLRYFSYGVRRAARATTSGATGGAPFVLLFHLIDFADPASPADVNGWGFRTNIFTLSLMSAGHKRAACERMVAVVRGYFALGTTAAWLASEHPAAPSMSSPADRYAAR